LLRDRAKERREGVNVDFADAEQQLASHGLGPGALQHLSIEQSKFLGGDIAHTHLVKGLDYALLHQVCACVLGLGLQGQVA
jgi:IK cytokine